LAADGAPTVRVRAAVRFARRARHWGRPVRHSGYVAGLGLRPPQEAAWARVGLAAPLRAAVPGCPGAASDLARFSAAAPGQQGRGLAGSARPVVSAQQAAAPRPAARDAAAGWQPAAARVGRVAQQWEAPVAETERKREVPAAAAALLSESPSVPLWELPLVQLWELPSARLSVLPWALPSAAPWVFLLAPVRQPAARFARGMQGLQIASPSELSWQAARDEVLS
jgi:hypothetical protein